MSVVARATSAGPTYFEPESLADHGKQRVLVDGGVYINNPAMLAFAMAATDRPVALLSLGTGTRNPAAPSSLEQIKAANWVSTVRRVMDASMTGGGQMGGNAVLTNLTSTVGRPQHYWRIQTSVDRCSFAMDDSSPGNIACLGELADKLVEQSGPTLDEIVAVL